MSEDVEDLKFRVKVLVEAMREYCSHVGDWDHEELAYYYQGFFEKLIEAEEK